MPLPKRKPGETENKFIARCMGDTKVKEEFPNGEQRFAVCKSQARKKK